MAEEQEQWPQAYEYYAKALAIAHEFNDDYRNGTRQDSLRRLWQKHPDEALLAVLAGVLGQAVEDVRGWLTVA